MANKISPAKILPNNLKENDIILDISDKNSNIPTKKLIGLEKFINFLRCVNNPKTTIPKKLVAKTEIIANAKVKFKSAAGDLNSGTDVPPLLKITDPTPGSRPNQFEVSIKIKTVAINGKYFSAASLVPKTDSINPKSPSIPISTTPCTIPGTILILLLKITEKINNTKDATSAKSKPFVMLKFPIVNICCAFKDISIFYSQIKKSNSIIYQFLQMHNSFYFFMVHLVNKMPIKKPRVETNGYAVERMCWPPTS